MWTPSADVIRLIDLQILDIREPLQSEFYTRQVPDIVEEMAVRGLARSGALLSAKYRAAESVVTAFADGFIDQVPRRMEALYGNVPVEAWPWILHQYDQHVGGCAVQLGQTIDSEAASVGAGGPVRFAEALKQAAHQRRRRLEIQATTAEIGERLRNIASGDLPSQQPGPRSYDVFVSYAGEDGDEVALPLAAALKARGFSVWIDKRELRPGMNVYKAIDDGLRACKFGVVVLSPAFFGKHWPEMELNALAALAATEGKTKILPVWHRLEQTDMVRYSPLLAGVWAAKTKDGIDKVVDQIVEVLRGPSVVDADDTKGPPVEDESARLATEKYNSLSSWPGARAVVWALLHFGPMTAPEVLNEIRSKHGDVDDGMFTRIAQATHLIREADTISARERGIVGYRGRWEVNANFKPTLLRLVSADPTFRR